MINLVLQTPSLQHLAAVKVATVLWNIHHANRGIAEILHFIREDSIEWVEAIDKVKAKLLALELTLPCKQRVVNLFESIGMEIDKWYMYHYKNGNDEHLFLKWFCWSMLGTVDYAKTAELMVKDEMLDNAKRYEIACFNCMEDEARELMKSIPEERRRDYTDLVIDFNGMDPEYKKFIAFFTCTLSGDTDQLNVCFQQVLTRGISINHYLFKQSLHSFNRAKSEYFFNKLNQTTRDFYLENLPSHFETCYAPNVLFYLSLMNEEQKRHLFPEYMADVLICCLRWPLQPLFVEAAECGRRYMAYGDYETLLGAVTWKISYDIEDYDYFQLFREFWRLTPAAVQQSLLDNAGFLVKLLETEKEELIKLILNKAPAHQLLELSNNFHEKCQVLLDESVISDAVLVKCKEKAALKSSKKEKDAEKRLRSEHLNQLVDVAIEERIKRRLV